MATIGHLRGVLDHITAAIDLLPTDDELDRLINPRHTDHDRHVYLPTKVMRGFADARRELQAAIDELSDAKQGG